MARARHSQGGYLERLREVEGKLTVLNSAIAERLAETDVAGATASDSTEIDELRERHEVIRAQRGAIGEKLSQLHLEIRKLQSVMTQMQMSADYLAGNFGDTDADLLPLTQVWALEAQEEERRRLAREIHDGPAQVLANATFQLEYCQRLLERDPIRAATEIDRLKGDLREGLAEVRSFIFDLRPGPLAEYGLAATVHRYATNFQSRSGIAIDLDLNFEIQRLSPTKEVAIFRIVQEALQNVRKHSRSARVRITIDSRVDTLFVAIVDDGVGFDSRARTEAGERHFGLSSMEERARLIRSDLRIMSVLDKGTTVELRVPLDDTTIEG